MFVVSFPLWFPITPTESYTIQYLYPTQRQTIIQIIQINVKLKFDSLYCKTRYILYAYIVTISKIIISIL